jgi:hypothetical protein
VEFLDRCQHTSDDIAYPSTTAHMRHLQDRSYYRLRVVAGRLVRSDGSGMRLPIGSLRSPLEETLRERPPIGPPKAFVAKLDAFQRAGPTRVYLANR